MHFVDGVGNARAIPCTIHARSTTHPSTGLHKTPLDGRYISQSARAVSYQREMHANSMFLTPRLSLLHLEHLDNTRVRRSDVPEAVHRPRGNRAANHASHDHRTNRLRSLDRQHCLEARCAPRPARRPQIACIRPSSMCTRLSSPHCVHDTRTAAAVVLAVSRLQSGDPCSLARLLSAVYSGAPLQGDRSRLLAPPPVSQKAQARQRRTDEGSAAAYRKMQDERAYDRSVRRAAPRPFRQTQVHRPLWGKRFPRFSG